MNTAPVLPHSAMFSDEDSTDFHCPDSS